jgi:hypothetical protein
VLHRDLDRRVARERHVAGEHLVEDDADRVEIGGSGHLRAASLLRREVVGGAHDRAGLGHLRRAGARDAEVGDLQPLFGADQDVVRLDVAVDDPVLVREAERRQDLPRVRDRLCGTQAAVLSDQLLQARSVDDLHRDVVGAFGLAPVVDRDDVRV